MRRIGEKKKPKTEVKKVVSTPVPKASTPKENLVAKAQIDATLALTEIAARAIDNPQLTRLIDILSHPKEAEVKSNKRLTVNRDINGLIESIDIKEI